MGWLGVVLIDYVTSRSPSIQLLGAFLLPVVGLLVGRLACRLGRYREWSLPAALGAVFIVGGTIFDLTATFLHSPALDLEANPAIRVLLDSGHSLRFVYGYIFITHGIFAWSFTVLWLVYLNHCPFIVTSAGAVNPASWWEFLKAATGGGHLSWRQWALPLRRSEMPLVYFWVWPATLTGVYAATIFRWYAGLEWFNVITPTLENRCIALTIAIFCPVCLYVVWLFAAYGRWTTTALRPTLNEITG